MSLSWVIFHVRILRFRIKRVSRQFAFLPWNWRFRSNGTLLLTFIILIIFWKWVALLRIVVIVHFSRWFYLTYLPTFKRIITGLPKSSTVIIKFILPVFFFWFLTSIKWVLSKLKLSGKWVVFVLVVLWERIGYFGCIWSNRFIEFKYCFCNLIGVFKSIEALLFWCLILFLYTLLLFYFCWIRISIWFLLFRFLESWKIVRIWFTFLFERIEKIVWLLWLFVTNLPIFSGIHWHLAYIFVFDLLKKHWVWVCFKLPKRCIIIFFLLIIFRFLKI